MQGSAPARSGRFGAFREKSFSFRQDTDGREETCEWLAPWRRGGLGSEKEHVVRSTR